MTIKEFLQGYGFTATKAVPTGTASTPQELYDRCTAIVCPETKTITDAIIGWHELLLRYVEKNGAVLLSRLYESQKTNGIWDNRRNSLTISKNYNYAFCSNHFPRLILTMALNGFVPDDKDFWDMLVVNREFYLSALFGMAPVEKRISAYRSKPYKVDYYTPGWYLAHIASVLDAPYKGCSHIDIKNIFKLGAESEWRFDISNGCMMRTNTDTVNNQERDFAVAHFLRLVDPINYFLVPNKKNVIYKRINHTDKTPLGENELVVKYMQIKAYERFGDAFLSFIDKALVEIDIDYQVSQYAKIASSKICATFGNGINQSAKEDTFSQLKNKYTYDKLIEIAAYYLRNNIGFKKIEENLHLKENKGFEARNILNALGMEDTSGTYKGLLAKTDIDEAIANATGRFKETLEEIKRRGL